MTAFPKLPADQLTAFLSAIREDPDADGPRLVFADWLDDHGDPRAELIRVQCQLAALNGDDPGAADLRERQRAWLERYRDSWPGKHHVLISCSLERGLLHVHLDASLLKHQLVPPWLVQAIHQGWVIPLEVYANPQAMVKWVASRAAGRTLGLKRRLDELPTLLIRIIDVPKYLPFLQPLSRLGCLNLSATSFQPEHLEPLRHLTGLRSLLLGHSSITSAGLAYLDGLTELRRLDLHGCGALSGAGLGQLAALPNLTHLDLSGTKITVADLKKLQAVPGLRVLDLGQKAIPADELETVRRGLPGVTIRCGPTSPERSCALC